MQGVKAVFFMKWWRRIGEWLKHQKKEDMVPEKREKEPKSFFLYMKRVPEVLTYLRRMSGIPLQNLELVVVDNEEKPAWQVERILELLVPGLNLLYLLTDRPECFQELSEAVFEEQGLLMTVTNQQEIRNAGNLILDLCDWEMHLDIIS